MTVKPRKKNKLLDILMRL